MDPNVIVSEFVANHTELFGGFCIGVMCSVLTIIAVTFCLGSWIVFFVWLRRFLRRRDLHKDGIANPAGNDNGGERK